MPQMPQEVQHEGQLEEARRDRASQAARTRVRSVRSCVWTQRHTSSAHSQAARQVRSAPCFQCGKTYSSDSALMKHVRTVHDGVIANPRPCPKCDYVADFPSKLRRHFISRHTRHDTSLPVRVWLPSWVPLRRRPRRPPQGEAPPQAQALHHAGAAQGRRQARAAGERHAAAPVRAVRLALSEPELSRLSHPGEALLRSREAEDLPTNDQTTNNFVSFPTHVADLSALVARRCSHSHRQRRPARARADGAAAASLSAASTGRPRHGLQ